MNFWPTLLLSSASIAVLFTIAILLGRYLRPQPFERPVTPRPMNRLELDVSDPPCRCGAYQPVDSKRLACFWCGRLLSGATVQASDVGANDDGPRAA